jgi:hypothetical protein
VDQQLQGEGHNADDAEAPERVVEFLFCHAAAGSWAKARRMRWASTKRKRSLGSATRRVVTCSAVVSAASRSALPTVGLGEGAGAGTDAEGEEAQAAPEGEEVMQS